MDRTEDVRRAQRGNHEAFVLLIKEYELSMYRVAKSYLKTDPECADAMQETILKAFQAIRTLKEPKYFKTWLFRILINECIRLRKQSVQVVSMAEIAEGSCRIETQQGLEIWEAVQSLEEEFRVVIALFYMEDVPLKEVAQILDIPEGTVKSRLYRAREKLAHFIREERGVTYE